MLATSPISDRFYSEFQKKFHKNKQMQKRSTRILNLSERRNKKINAKKMMRMCRCDHMIIKKYRQCSNWKINENI